jgi:hypothetical protein
MPQAVEKLHLAEMYARGVRFGDFIRRLERGVGRFNRWFGPAALSSNATDNNPHGTVDPAHLGAMLGEIGKTQTSREEREQT